MGKIIIAVFVLVSFFMSHPVLAEDGKDKVEILLVWDAPIKDDWRKLVENPKARKILENADFYSGVPNWRKDGDLKRLHLVNSYFLTGAPYLGEGWQFKVVDKIFFNDNRDESKKIYDFAADRIKKISDSGKEEEMKERMKKLDMRKSWLAGKAAKVEKGRGKSVPKTIYVFVNGEYVPDFWDSIK